MPADLIASGILVLVVLVLRYGANRFITNHTKASTLERRRWQAAVRSVTLALIIAGLVIIWSSALNTFAVSVAAFVVAIVIATKEVLLCFTGAIVRTSIDSIEIGDWVEINGLEGEVSENAILTTTLMAVNLKGGTYECTGRSVSIPNSLFLTAPVQLIPKNEFIVHGFTITFDRAADASAVVALAEEEVTAATQNFADDAAAAAVKIRRKTKSDFPSTDPEVSLSTTDIGKQRLHVRWFCPLKDAPKLEMGVRLAVAKHLKALADEAVSAV